MEGNDEELLVRWREGDQLAGSELLSRYFSPLYDFFATKIDTGIDDLIQRTMLACVQARDRIRDAPNFRAFVYGVARHELYGWFRDRARGARVLDFEAISIADLGSTPSRRLAGKQEQRLMLEALRRIPLDHQICLELFYWEGMSGPGLAAVLDVPEGTARTRLRRARQLLLLQLEALAETPEVLQSTRDGLERWASELRARVRS
ncbi:MAG: sigma-70 family RNA polymerase sigma factor [Myxococcota bacterium]